MAENSAPGSDGWLPRELKLLPLAAWEQRSRILQLMADTGELPKSYKSVHSAAIPKKDDLRDYLIRYWGEPVGKQYSWLNFSFVFLDLNDDGDDE